MGDTGGNGRQRPTSYKRYLGDGVYVDVTPLGITLTTEDGIRTTNTIVLEQPTWVALMRYVHSLEGG